MSKYLTRKRNDNRNPQARIQSDLKKFWDKHKYISKEARLEWLIILANNVYEVVPKDVVAKKRLKFNKQLDKGGGNSILHYKVSKDKWLIVKCKACEENNSTARHHVIQLQYGGHNGRRNRIALCDDCHRIIHPWMYEDLRFSDIH